MSLNDFPTRDHNSELQATAEAAFEYVIVQAAKFVVQQHDRRDYGTDFQLEAKSSGGMTNFRVHVQLKGTEKSLNKDGSVSISVARTNLNYMLSQPNSIYVCYHCPTQEFLFRTADDVFKDAEHNGEEWRSQESLTIRFRMPFNLEVQSKLQASSLAEGISLRDDRLRWVTTPAKDFPREVAVNVPTISVPGSPNEAWAVLNSLFEAGKDDVISKAFDKFYAILQPDDQRLVYLYLSEFNLAMRHQKFNSARVAEGIEFLKRTRPDGAADVLYCRANGHSALGQAEDAKQLYCSAIEKIASGNPPLSAQCCKNLGSQLEFEGDQAGADSCYERAIELYPELMEAHLALAMSHRNKGDLEKALQYFDRVVWAVDDSALTVVARGHRLGVCFELGMAEKAFEDILAILPYHESHSWILDWCGRAVYNHARSGGSSVQAGGKFWDRYLRLRPNDRMAQKERLLCLAYAKMHGHPVAIGFNQFLNETSDYLAHDATDEAHLWDRVGHWAQVDGDWQQAEQQYRKAYSIEPDRYGYCLGTALNQLGRFEEALPVLLEQATTYQLDAPSWFQVACAQEGTGDVPGSMRSYETAISLDPDYDLAYFNLGGLCLNSGLLAEARKIWTEAAQRFPSHPLTAQVQLDFPELLGMSERLEAPNSEEPVRDFKKH